MRHDVIILIFFFFSSRRRHTRLTCDWSSDVCSSDLSTLTSTGCGRSVTGRRSSTTGRTPITPRGRRLRRLSRPSGHGRTFWRSEEHTSELQSHVNLVCRLLLEKKKEKKQKKKTAHRE